MVNGNPNRNCHDLHQYISSLSYLAGVTGIAFGMMTISMNLPKYLKLVPAHDESVSVTSVAMIKNLLMMIVLCKLWVSCLPVLSSSKSDRSIDCLPSEEPHSILFHDGKEKLVRFLACSLVR